MAQISNIPAFLVLSENSTLVCVYLYLDMYGCKSLFSNEQSISDWSNDLINMSLYSLHSNLNVHMLELDGVAILLCGLTCRCSVKMVSKCLTCHLL